jgi:hypothetical protein
MFHKLNNQKHKIRKDQNMFLLQLLEDKKKERLIQRLKNNLVNKDYLPVLVLDQVNVEELMDISLKENNFSSMPENLIKRENHDDSKYLR